MTSTQIIGFAAAVLLASASPGWGTESPVAAAPSETVPLYKDLGSHHKSISTKVPAAQQYFDQGLRFVYGFNHAEAIRSFKHAAKLDPTCAMCFPNVSGVARRRRPAQRLRPRGSRTVPVVVVLSSCSVANAKVVQGGSLLGLANAFTTLGAASVIAPLTPISDAASVTVMDRLHRSSSPAPIRRRRWRRRR